MPRRRRKQISWGKVATITSLVLVFIASVPMNLLTSWLHDDVFINAFYTFLVIFLLVALVYLYQSKKKKEHKILKKVFWFLIATVALNLFSIWIQYSLLDNKFSVPIITIVLLSAMMILAASALFESYDSVVRSITMKRVWQARQSRPPEYPRYLAKKGMKRPMPKSGSRRKKNT